MAEVGPAAISPAADRLALVEALVPDIPGAEASRLEIDRGGPSYSVDTAEEILAEAGGQPVELYLVVGADLVPELGPGTAPRTSSVWSPWPSFPGPPGPRPAVPPGWRAERVDGPQVSVSSSDIRDRLAEGRPVEGMLPKAVIRCILRRALYAVA